MKSRAGVQLQTFLTVSAAQPGSQPDTLTWSILLKSQKYSPFLQHLLNLKAMITFLHRAAEITCDGNIFIFFSDKLSEKNSPLCCKLISSNWKVAETGQFNTFFSPLSFYFKLEYLRRELKG